MQNLKNITSEQILRRNDYECMYINTYEWLEGQTSMNL